MTNEFYQSFKEELTPILSRLFQKIEHEETLSDPFCKASITLTPNPGQDTTGKENCRPIISEEYAEILRKQ